jgi:ABC-type molybdate transport system substrate-binding protein
LGITAANLLQVLTDPRTRLATSTPVSDPMGDYTWQFFRKAGSHRPGSYEVLSSKAIRLSGVLALNPDRKPPYVAAFEENRADAYVMYCTNAVSTRREVPTLAITRIPDELNVRSAYAIGASPGSEAGQRFVRFVLSADGQRILKKHGFN